MNRLLLLLCMAAGLVSCSHSYKIDGTTTITDIDGKTLSLKTQQGEDWQVLDSCEVLHGQFALSGKVDSTFVATLFVDACPLMPVIMEPGRMKVDISNISLSVSGTDLNDSLYNFIGRKRTLDMRAKELEHVSAQMIMNGYSEGEIAHRVDSLFHRISSEMEELVCTFIRKNYNNVLSVCGFSMLCNGLPRPMMTPLIQRVLEGAPREFFCKPVVHDFLMATHSRIDGHHIACTSDSL